MNKLMKIILLLVLAAFCSLASAQEPDYADTGSWAYWRVGENKPSDLFIVCPTVDIGTGGNINMSLDVNEAKKNFYGEINMERGIYKQHCRVHATYYRQALLEEYDVRLKNAEPYFHLGY